VYWIVKMLIILAYHSCAWLSEEEVDFMAKIHKVYNAHPAITKPIWR